MNLVADVLGLSAGVEVAVEYSYYTGKVKVNCIG